MYWYKRIAQLFFTRLILEFYFRRVHKKKQLAEAAEALRIREVASGFADWKLFLVPPVPAGSRYEVRCCYVPERYFSRKGVEVYTMTVEHRDPRVVTAWAKRAIARLERASGFGEEAPADYKLSAWKTLSFEQSACIYQVICQFQSNGGFRLICSYDGVHEKWLKAIAYDFEWVDYLSHSSPKPKQTDNHFPPENNGFLRT